MEKAAICSACHNKRRVRKSDGMIETHFRAGNNYSGNHCKGSLQPPLEQRES